MQRFLFTPAILLLLTAPGFAQAVGGRSETLGRLDGTARNDNFGRALAPAGDVDGDGFDDLIVGTNQIDQGGSTSVGAAYIYSGADGSLLYQWFGNADYDYFGTSVSAAGDVDQDGFDDVLVGAIGTDTGGMADTGAAYLYSGADGSLLFQWNGALPNDDFGISVSRAGDVDLDGYEDVIIGAEDATVGGIANVGSAYVYSGRNGVLIHQMNGPGMGSRFGASVHTAGDVDGDGSPDVIVGAPNAAPALRGTASVYSGRTGALLRQWTGFANNAWLGYSVAGAGDLDGDGMDDLIVGAVGVNYAGVLSCGAAYFLSGADGSILHEKFGTQFSGQYGASVAKFGDVDGDGIPEALIGEPSTYSGFGAAHLYSGIDGSLLHRWDSPTRFDAFGNVVAFAGDTNADGHPDLLIAANNANPSGLQNAGSVYVYSFHPFLTANTPFISAAAGATVDLSLDFPITAATFDYKVLLSATGTGPSLYGVEIPLAVDPLTVSSFAGNYPFPQSLNLQGTLDANGDSSSSFRTSPGLPAAFIGNTLYLAAVANQPGQLPEYSSIAISFEIVP